MTIIDFLTLAGALIGCFSLGFMFGIALNRNNRR